MASGFRKSQCAEFPSSEGSPALRRRRRRRGPDSSFEALANARALHAMGYRGPVCMAAFAFGDAEAALAAFRAAFTV